MNPFRYVGAGVCLVLAGLSGYWAWAEFVAIGPRALMANVENTHTPPQDADWQSAYQLLATSLSIKPADADLQYEAGRMAWWQSLHVVAVPKERSQWLAAARQHLSLALAQRPTWGRAWAELANVHLQQRDYRNAQVALKKAMELEPYEGSTQWMVFWTGFMLWPVLMEEDRTLFLHIVRAALANKSYYWVIDPAVQYHHENVLTDLVVGDAAAMRHIQSRVRDRDRVRREQ